MRVFKKALSSVLVLSVVCLYFPKIGLAGQGRLIAKASTATTITKHKPGILSLPEKDIPFDDTEIPGDGEKKKWGRYVLAGAAVVGLIVLVAAIAGGGGGGGNGNGPETGDVTVSW